jgi:hypothetical protein
MVTVGNVRPSRLAAALLLLAYLLAGAVEATAGSSVAVALQASPAPPLSADEQRAEQRAHAYLGDIFGAAPLDRARVEVRAFAAGWMVVYRDAYVSCGPGTAGSDDCRWGPIPQRDVFACIAREGFRVYGLQTTEDSLGPENRCALDVCYSIYPPPTYDPTVTRRPLPTPIDCPTAVPATPVALSAPTATPTAGLPPVAGELTPGERQAVEAADEIARRVFGGRAVARSYTEVYQVGNGWVLVVYRDAWASCAEGWNETGWCRSWGYEPPYIDVSQDGEVCIRAPGGGYSVGRGSRASWSTWLADCEWHASQPTVTGPIPVIGTPPATATPTPRRG